MKAVFFDIDTQLDFMVPAGALYVPGAEKILENVAALNRRAPLVISTMDAHAENDPEFLAWPHHAVAGCLGQRKPVATLLERPLVIPNRACAIALDGARQIIIEKQTLDCFTNLHFQPILASLDPERCIVYGVVTEICVRLAAFGLLKTGRRVELVTDAVRNLNDQAASRMLADFQAAGGRLTTAAAA